MASRHQFGLMGRHIQMKTMVEKLLPLLCGGFFFMDSPLATTILHDLQRPSRSKTISRNGTAPVFYRWRRNVRANKKASYECEVPLWSGHGGARGERGYN